MYTGNATWNHLGPERWPVCCKFKYFLGNNNMKKKTTENSFDYQYMKDFNRPAPKIASYMK